jgi:hypothetical protein
MSEETVQTHLDIFLVQCLEFDPSFWEGLILGKVIEPSLITQADEEALKGWRVISGSDTPIRSTSSFIDIVKRDPVKTLAKRLQFDREEFGESLQMAMSNHRGARLTGWDGLALWLSFDQDFVATVTMEVSLEIERDLSQCDATLAQLVFEDDSNTEDHRKDTGILKVLHESEFSQNVLGQCRESLEALISLVGEKNRTKIVPQDHKVNLRYGDKTVHSCVFISGFSKKEDFTSILNCDGYLESICDNVMDETCPIDFNQKVGWSFSVFNASIVKNRSFIYAALFSMQRRWFFLKKLKQKLEDLVQDHFRFDENKEIIEERLRVCNALVIRYQMMAVSYRNVKDMAPTFRQYVMKVQGSWNFDESLAEIKSISYELLQIYRRQLESTRITTDHKQQSLLGIIAIVQVLSLSSVVFDYYETLHEASAEQKTTASGAFVVFGGLDSSWTTYFIEWTPLISVIFFIIFALAWFSSERKKAREQRLILLKK